LIRKERMPLGPFRMYKEEYPTALAFMARGVFTDAEARVSRPRSGHLERSGAEKPILTDERQCEEACTDRQIVW
jgi:hypothetical protein